MESEAEVALQAEVDLQAGAVGRAVGRRVAAEAVQLVDLKTTSFPRFTLMPFRLRFGLQVYG